MANNIAYYTLSKLITYNIPLVWELLKPDISQIITEIKLISDQSVNNITQHNIKNYKALTGQPEIYCLICIYIAFSNISYE